MHQDPASEAIIQQAFRAIEDMAADHFARQQRIDADPTVIRLRAFIAEHQQPITHDGMAGGEQVFASLGSPEHAAVVNAKRQLTARIRELSTPSQTHRAA